MIQQNNSLSEVQQISKLTFLIIPSNQRKLLFPQPLNMVSQRNTITVMNIYQKGHTNLNKPTAESTLYKHI